MPLRGCGLGGPLQATKARSNQFDAISFVIAGLVPAISLRRVRRFTKRDARVKPAHDELRGVNAK
jgi:hypothetical protein